MKTLAQKLHALEIDTNPKPKPPTPGAALLHAVALIPAGYCRNCWSYGRAIQIADTCPVCQFHTSKKTVEAQLKIHRETPR